MDEEERKSIRKNRIIDLVVAYYNKFDFLKNRDLNELINKVLDEYLDSDLSIEEINDELIKTILNMLKKVTSDRDEEKGMDNNELYSRLDALAALLADKGIDYQVGGGLSPYLEFGEDPSRIHDDIDLNLNEDDLDDFEKICNTLGYSFYDNRNNSTRILKNGYPYGEHEVGAKIPGSKLHIGIFCFNRNKDGSVDNKSYYKDENGKTRIWNEHFSSKLAKLIFGGKKIDFNGKKINITPSEYIYSIKSYTRNNKDLRDLRFMDGKINMDRLNEIISLSKTDRRVDLIGVEDSFHNEKDELGTMLKPEVEKEKSAVLEKPKVFMKTDNRNKESGFIHYRQIIIPFIVLVVMVILIEIFNFIS